MHTSITRQLLCDDTCARARAMARRLGERLLVHETAPSRDLDGSPGTALAFLALARSTGDERYTAQMHARMRDAARLDDAPENGLFSGISGLRAAAAIIAQGEPAYARLVGQCDSYVDAQLPAHATVPQTFMTYDVVSGWSGVRLARCVDGPKEADRLVELIAWLLADPSRWCCAHPLRGGNENDLGLAHGVAGMLAALALTLRDPDAQLREVLARAAQWLVAQAQTRDGVSFWLPTRQSAGAINGCRSAWCYGAAGIGAALYAVASLLEDRELETFAISTLEALGALPSFAMGLDDPAICHGTMGNALVYASVADASGVRALGAVAERLVRETIDVLDENGAICWAYSGREETRYDAFGELTGIAGIVLGLLTLCGDMDARWMRCHALQPLR